MWLRGGGGGGGASALQGISREGVVAVLKGVIKAPTRPSVGRYSLNSSVCQTDLYVSGEK